jgi:hypothetical protein
MCMCTYICIIWTYSIQALQWCIIVFQTFDLGYLSLLLLFVFSFLVFFVIVGFELRALCFLGGALLLEPHLQSWPELSLMCPNIIRIFPVPLLYIFLFPFLWEWSSKVISSMKLAVKNSYFLHSLIHFLIQQMIRTQITGIRSCDGTLCQ